MIKSEDRRDVGKYYISGKIISATKIKIMMQSERIEASVLIMTGIF